ncbi:unnamed protein product [Zymoseptoria tritici ST99CH_1E4]|uniref:Uncharacterized protein n=1 Tax=Zymoseptoria tritici ST99CH_1E4 TaxID=1276532 RepID=A0A2H1G6C2_ZYMTR|nr:unnamed protein product [Zymoseptoria tritici ST99CH_1E4]
MPSMSMFSRSSSRQRGSSTSRTRSQSMDQSTISNAALAANTAFAQRNTSSSNLSAAAAAAALRSRPTSPEPVGSLQTKRMVRRGSQSSIGSGSVISTINRGGPSQRGLVRQTSSGSMTDRTFRSPSPGRNNSLNGARSPDRYAPPVPPIPASVHRRAASVDPSQRRVISTPPSSSRSRGVSADRASSMSTRKPPRLSDVAEEMLDRGESQRKMNFSRPRPGSPGGSVAGSVTGSVAGDRGLTHGTGAWFSEPVGNKAANGDEPTSPTALEQKIARIQAAQGQGRPASSRQNSTQSQQGAYLTKANLEAASAAAARGPAPVQYETVMVFDAGTRTFQPQQRVKTTPDEPPSPIKPQAPRLAPGSYDPNTRTIVPGAKPAQKATQQPIPRPQSQQSARPDMLPPPRNPARLSPNSSPRNSYIGTSPAEPQTPAAPARPSTAGNNAVQLKTTLRHTRSSSLDVPRGGLESANHVRNVSASPSPHRAHFSASPVVATTIHNPPTRALSPAKSAMKHSPAPSERTASPLYNYKGPASETSETPSKASDDGAKKKRSVRVSFDENPAVAPIVSAASTPSRPALDDIDDEDFSKPRPALPSFGSVRKGRATPAFAEKVTEMAPESQDSSSDHAVGGMLHQANGIAKGGNDGHDELENSGSDMSIVDNTRAKQQDGSETVTRDFAAIATKDGNGDVPAINLSPPTPGVEEEGKRLNEQDAQVANVRHSNEVVVPGGWSAPDAEGDVDDEPTIHEEPSSMDSPIMARPTSPTLDPINEYTDSEAEDAFSDAAEDLSEYDNGGFASLDAIAISPVVQATQNTKAAAAASSPPDTPTGKRAARQNDSIDSTASNDASGDWSKATAYWSTLSRQQREEIERQHFSSDDESTPQARKTKKKVSTPQFDRSSSVQKSVPQSNAQPTKPALKKTMRAAPEPVAVPVEKPVQLRSSMRANGGSGLASSLRDGPKRQTSVKTALQTNSDSRPPSQVGSNGLPNAAARPAPAQRQESRNSMTSTTSLTSMKPHPAPVMTARLKKEIGNDSDSDSSFKKQRRPRSSGNTMKTSMRARAPPAQEQRRAPSPEPIRKKGRDSFSIRSLSPTGSLFGRKKLKDQIRGQSVDTGGRTTLRGPPPEPKRSTLRAAPAPAPKPAPKAAPKSAPRASKFKSRFNDSDSDDDAPAGGRFESRFADSDDSDDDVFTPSKLAPVRGIPRTQGRDDGDSTDLEGEEPDAAMFARREKMQTPLVPDPSDIDKAMEAARKKLGMPAPSASTPHIPQEGSALKTGSLRRQAQSTVDVSSRPEPKSRPEDMAADTTPKKRGFMGSILRRNRNSTQSVSTVSNYRPSSEVVVPPTPILPREATTSKPSTPTSPSAVATPPPSRGKLVRRSSAMSDSPGTPQLPATRLKRGDSSFSTATAPASSIERAETNEWSIPAVPKIPAGFDRDGRPDTSDGTMTGVRFVEENGSKVRVQDFGSPEAGAGGGVIYSRRTGKKKRFGLLRKAFGLED